MRGKRQLFSSLSLLSRITPAGAGKTTPAFPTEARLPDHPRRCGENCYRLPSSEGVAGSPPQVRGKHRDGSGLFRHDRITPAGAGKTKTSFEVISSCQDHPRRCGENPCCRTAQKRKLGSPPQVRGKQVHFLDCGDDTGITPAGAGKTRPRRNAEGGNGDHPRRCGENENGYYIMNARKGSPPQVRGKLILVTLCA